MRTKVNFKFLTALFCVAAFVLLAGVAIIMPHAQVHAQNTDELYYFVNCGETSITEEETAFGLTGSLGSGDKAFADGWGYTGGGTVGGQSGSIFTRHRSGTVAYSFNLPAGEYQISIGISSASSASVSIGASQVDSSLNISENTIKAYNTTVTGSNVEISLQGANVCFIAVADKDAKIMLYAESQGAETVIYGDVVDSQADAYFSDGSVGTVGINYSNLNAVELNKNFNMIDARGVIEGTTFDVSRTLFTAPQNLIYWVNGGSYETANVDAGLDADVYYHINASVFDKYDTLLNDVPDQEFGGSNTWGYNPYVASFYNSSQPLPVKAGDPYPPPFPFNTVRCTDNAPRGITYKFTVEAGKAYSLYLGTLSHWHPRNATVTINGDVKGTVSIDGTNTITLYGNISPDASNLITITVMGPASQDEGMIAFIALQEDNSTNKPAAIPASVTAPGIIDFGQNEFEIGNVTAGTKIQVASAERPYSVVHEEIAQNVVDGKFTVTIPSQRLDGLFQLIVYAVSSGGASIPTPVFITDITGFNITQSTTEWTNSDIVLSLTGNASSGIKKLLVTHNFITDTVILDGSKSWSGEYTITENGVYDIRLESEIAFISESVSIVNIDKDPAKLSLSVATNNWTSDGKVPVKAVGEAVAGIVKFEVYKNGVKVESNTQIPDVYLAEPGEYTFMIVTESGKIAAQALSIGTKPQTFNITSTADKNISVKVNGENLTRILAYEVKSDGTLDRQTVIDYGFTVLGNEYSGKYVIVAECENGTIEMCVLNLSDLDSGKKSGCGSVISSASLMGYILPLTLLTASLLLIVRKKKVKEY